MKASIIIPTYNKLPRLKLTLASILNQTYSKDDFEVLVIDDGSTDGTGEYLESLEMEISLKYFGQVNSGRAAARNKGVREAIGDIIIFIDDDVLLCPRFIETHLKLQENRQSVVHGKILTLPFLKFFMDPSKGILYNGLSGRWAELRKNCISEEDVYWNFEQSVMARAKVSYLEKTIKEIIADDAIGANWIGFTGGNVSIPRKWMINIGGFDENFGLDWGCEDIEAGYRLWKMGYEFIYSCEAANYHMAHYREKFKNEHLRTTTYFFIKHHDKKILAFQEFVEEKIDKEKLLNLIKE